MSNQANLEQISLTQAGDDETKNLNGEDSNDEEGIIFFSKS